MDIVEELRSNRENGARRLEAEYKAGLMALARRFFENECDAEELVNRTLAEAIANIDSLISRPALFGWMCQILVDCHAKDNRRKSRSVEAADSEAVEIAMDEDAEARLFREVDAGILRDAIDTLPADIRKTVVMHYFMDVPVREAAKVLAVPTGTIAWRVTPPSVRLSKVEEVLRELQERGLSEYIRVKQEVDKEAILSAPAGVAGIPGISICQREEFVVEPAEDNVPPPVTKATVGREETEL